MDPSSHEVVPPVNPLRSALVLNAEAERIATIDALADEMVASVRRPNTVLAFADDWKYWNRFCEREGLPVTSCSPGLLVAFVTWLAHDDPDSHYPQAPATISRRIAGVIDNWKRLGVDVPHGVSSKARKIIDEYQKELVRRGESTGRGASRALTVEEMRQISALLPDELRGIRDRALLTVGFAIAGRRSEIAALTVTDIVEHPRGMHVRIRDSKSGERKVAVRPGTSELTCPVRSWRTWLERSGIGHGPAFRRIDKWGNVLDAKMTGHAVNDAVAQAGRLIGVKITGHSLRSGLATEARRAGHDVKAIAKQGGWVPHSPVLYGYMQIVDEWDDNATQGLGL